MRIFFKQFTIAVLLGCFTAPLAGQRFTFRKHEVNDGLSENTVKAIIQDHQGFMWFGTKDGLNRFDGRDYKIFRFSASNPHSIGNNFIHALFQHSDGTIWVGTDYRLYLLNPLTEQFSLFDRATEDGVKIVSAITSICPEDEYVMWIGTRTQGVFRYDAKTSELVQFSTTTPVSPLKSDVVWQVYRDMSGTIWVGTRKGLSRYSKETKLFTTYEAGSETGLIDSEIMEIFEDSDGDLWLGTWSGGLARMTKATSTFKVWFHEDDPTYITHIRSIFEYEKNKLLIGSDDGLYLFNKTNGNYHRIDNPNDHYSLSDQNVYSIHRDREGGIWIGTYFGGVNYVSPNYSNIEHYYPNPSPHSMSGKAVSQFLEDEKGNLWIATEDGGLNYFDRKLGTFRTFHPSDSKGGISYHNIHSLLLDGHFLWVGTFSRGIDKLDLRTLTSKNYQHNPTDTNSINDNCVFALYKNRKGQILVGTPFGLNQYNPKSDNFTRISEVRSFVYNIKEDHQGSLWVATYGNGLYRLHHLTNRWINYRHDPNDTTTISHNKILKIYLDDIQRLWFATEGGGIFRYNYEQNNFTTINGSHGLPNNVVYGILDDKYGNIWASTNHGITRINPETLEIKNYTREDGLQSNQFNYRSSFKASDGTFFFGGVNGFNAFRPDMLRDNNYVPPVIITNVELLDVDTPHYPDLSQIITKKDEKRLVLKHNQASIRISFVSLSFQAQGKNKYTYFLENFNSRWISAGNQRNASYINLPPGNYRFRVKGSNNDGVWNTEGDYLDIKVLPPFWQSPGAYAIYLLLSLLLIFIAIKYITLLYRKRQRQRLEAYKAEKEKEMYASKINLFTNIAHEIRTPVSLIKAPLECIIKSGKELNYHWENLKVIERNTDRLLDLINQLLDFRKLEENGYRLNFLHTNISELVTDICYRFNPSAEQRNLRLHSSFPPETIYAYVDKEAITKIVSNLLTNALKFATCVIEVTLKDHKESGGFEVIVSDDGIGIAEEYYEKVFEPFYQINSTPIAAKKAGTGIGLALTRQLVDRHNGEIYILNNKPTGCSFIVRIPILKENPCIETPNRNSADDLCPSNFSNNNSNKLNIMVVEDNEELRVFIERNLGHEFNVFTSQNGEEALGLLEDQNIDLIISDIVMPIMDGIELVSKVKQNEQYCHIPIVLLSARTNLETKVEGLGCGADSYVDKPFSLEYLKAQVNSLLKNRQLVQEKFAKSPFFPSRNIAHNKRDEDFLKKLNLEIENNLSDTEFSIEKLSTALFMSRSNLQRKIKGLTALTPNDYIRVYRLKKSAKMLLDSNYRINEICYLVGFNSPSYFSKCFQKQFGVLPKDFAQTSISGESNHELSLC